MNATFTLKQLRRCARFPRFSRWPGRNVFQVLAVVSPSPISGRSRLINLVEEA